MPLNGTDFRRKAQFPLLLGSGAVPVLTMVLLGFAPEKAHLAWVFALAFALAGEVCLLVRGKARLLAGLAGCAAMAALGWQLLPAGGAWLAPACCMALVGLSLPMGGWPRGRELHPGWLVAGLLMHLAAQLMVNVARRTGENGGYIAAAPMLIISFILFAALAMLSINRSSMDTASMGRQKIPASMRRMNTLLTCGLLAVTLLISAIPAIRRWLEQAWDWLMVMLVRFLSWLAQLLPKSESTGEGPVEPADMGGFGDAVSEPSKLALILEKVAFVIAAIAAVILAILALRFLYRQLKKLARRLMDMMRRYAAAATEDYDDEITDTREDGERERSKPLQALRRRLALGDDRSLPPAERIRRRYARLRLKHTDWQDSRTARETLPGDAAGLYERARYSEHPVTAEDADQFARDTRAV
ncbi:MAG: hypothetical protein ACI4O7_14720 [Aristaeellaceae bacterium]